MDRQRELSLEGKTVIITGASRGVGKQAAFDFARRGANVVLAARTVNPDDTLPGTLGETLQQLEALGTGRGRLPCRPICPRRKTFRPSSMRRSIASAGWTSWSTTPRQPRATTGTSARWS